MSRDRRIDDTNKAIVSQLEDGRKPYSAIAESLGITENTVRARVNRMQEEGVLRIMGLVDPEKVPGLQVVMMGVKLKSSAACAACSALPSSPGAMTS